MSTQVRHLVFAKSTGTGTQSVTGIGFEGKAAIFWSTKQTAVGVTDGFRWMMGMTDGTTQVCRQHAREDSAASPKSLQVETVSHVLQFSSLVTTPVVLAEATFSGFTADGFDLDWTTNDGVADLIHVVVFDCDAAYLAHFKTTGTTAGTTQDVTGVGFAPDAILWIPGSDTGGTGYSLGSPFGGVQGFGFSDPASVANRTMWGRVNGGTGTVTDADGSAAFAIPLITGIFAGNVVNSMAVTATGADGFTLTRLASFGVTNTYQYALCLSGVTVSVGTISSPTVTGLQEVSLPFRASAVIVEGTGDQSGARFSVGAWDDVGDQAVATFATLSGTPTIEAVAETSDAVVRVVTPVATGSASPDVLKANVDSVAADSLTLNWTAVAGAQCTFAYIAFGSAEVPAETECFNGTVPTLADPDDGSEFTGLGPHEDRIFIEIDLDSGTKRYALHDPMNDPSDLAAHPGPKPGRIVSIGSIVRRTTDRLGGWQASTAGFTLDDGDRAIRALIDTQRWYNREVRIYVAKRGFAYDARCLFRGIIREYPPKADDAGAMTVDVEAIDIIGTEFTPFSLDKDVLAGVVFDRGRFPSLPQTLAETKPPQPVPALWGKWTDEGSDAAPPVLAGNSDRGSYFNPNDGRFNIGFANQPAGPAAPDTVSGSVVSGGSINLGVTPYNVVYAQVWGETSGVEGDPFPFYPELLPITITANGQKVRVTWTFTGSDPDHWRIALFVKYAGPRQVETIQVAGSLRTVDFDNLPWNGNGALASGATVPAYANRREFTVAARTADGLTGVSNPSGIHPYGGPYQRKPYVSWLPVADALSYEVYTAVVPVQYFGWTQKFVVPADQIDADGYVYLEYDWDAVGEAIDGLPVPAGMLPLTDVGDETIDGVAYGTLVLCRWPIHVWLGIHAGKQTIDLESSDILHADHPDWPFAERYRLFGDAACTVLYVKVGSDLLNAHRDGTALIQANACTTEDVGDGTGSTISQAARIAQDIITELVFNDRHGATRAGVPLFADGVPMVRTSSYAHAEAVQIERVGGTGYDNARVALDTAGTSLRSVIEGLVQSYGLHHGINRHGQVVCGHYDDAIDTTADYATFRDLREIVGPLEITPKTDELENVIPYRTDYQPVTKDFATDLDDANTDIYDDTAITANRNKRKPGPQRTLAYTADATTLADVLQRDLMLGKEVRQWVGIPTSIIGLSNDLFEIVQVTDEEGIGSSGYQGQFILVLEVEVIPPDPSQDRPLMVVLRGLDITALVDAAWVWGPDSLTTWDAMSSDEQGTYGAWAADADTIPSDDSPAKEWR